MQDLRHFFFLSRPLNVLISLFAFSLSCFLVYKGKLEFIQDPNFLWACFCIAGISSTGYWINDVFDFRIDQLNKPDKIIISKYLSSKKVITAYLAALFVIMVVSAFTLPWYVSLLNLGAAGLLFLYAWLLKRLSVLGNLLISGLAALVILYPVVLFQKINMPVVWTMAFAFEITFIRELVKDIEDLPGDVRHKLRTLPIAAGVKMAKQIAGMSIVVLILTAWTPVVLNYLERGEILLLYLACSVLTVQVPVAFLLRKLIQADKKEDYSSISKYLKIIILTGMGSVVFLVYS